jgi:glycosyltransferase involved in cell wall biosynthesis
LALTGFAEYLAQLESVDVLLVSPGTTAGWRRADGELVRALGELGISVAQCTSDYRVVRHLRRTMPLTDLAEAAAMRRALTKALRRYRPRAIVYSSTQATMLQPRRRLDGRTAVRFDTLAAVNRPGIQNSIQHRLERRGLAWMSVLLPSGLNPLERARGQLPPDATVVSLPLPIDAPADVRHTRDPVVLCYAGNPDKKGLDSIVAAWLLTRAPGLRLVVAGIDADEGRRFLSRRGLREPDGIEWAGAVEPARYRELSSRAAIFIAASRYEEYGLAQLEALADGALLVTAPSPGSYEALPPARELDGRLVAGDMSFERLADALRAALELSEEAQRAYRERARALVAPHSRAEMKRRLEHDVLPVLLP